jgi:hypothetical protein
MAYAHAHRGADISLLCFFIRKCINPFLQNQYAYDKIPIYQKVIFYMFVNAGEADD